MSIDKIKKETKKLVTKANYGGVFEFLRRKTHNDINSLDLIESSYNSVKKSKTDGTITDEEFDVKTAKIKKRILIYIDGLTDLNIKKEELSNQDYTKFFKKTYTQEYTSKTIANLGIALKKIYINPEFSVHKNFVYHNSNIDKLYISVEKIDIHKHLLTWLTNDVYREKNEIQKSYRRLIIVNGDSGQGKTSFCLKLVSDLSEEKIENRINIFFVKLSRINNLITLENNKIPELNRYFLSEHNISIDFEEEVKTIIILDGLNELSDLKSIDVHDSIKELQKIITRFPNLYLIISCREGYINLDELNTRDLIIFKLNKFSPKQQNEWLDKFYEIEKKPRLKREDLDKFKKNVGLSELMNQPLILQLLVKFDKISPDNINRSTFLKVYFDHIGNEEWKEKVTTTLTTKENRILRKALSLIAFLITRNKDGYFLKNRTINDYTEKEISDLKNTFKNRDVIELLLETAYLSKTKTEPSGDYSIGFNENIIREYLVAEFLFEKTTTFFNKKDIKKKETLTFISKYYAPININQEIILHLSDIIENKNQQENQLLANAMIEDLNYLAGKDFYTPMKESVDLPIDKALNAWHCYWIIYSHLEQKDCKIGSQAKSRITELIDYAARKNRNGLKFHGADLSGIKLKGAFLNNCNLIKSNLQNADLSGIDCIKGVFKGADLTKTNFEGANLEYADFSSLDEIDNQEHNDFSFSEDSLERQRQEENENNIFFETNPQLYETQLNESIFKNAKMHYANFNNTTLDKANFNGANLQKTDFSNAELHEVILCNADLRNAKFNGTLFNKTNLIGAKVGNKNWLQDNQLGADLARYKISSNPFLDTNRQEYYIIVSTHILVVTKTGEDTDDNVIVDSLRKDGYNHIQSIHVENSQEVINKLEEEDIDLVVFNNQNGYDFNSQLHIKIEGLSLKITDIAVLWLYNETDEYPALDISSPIFTSDILFDLGLNIKHLLDLSKNPTFN